MMWHRRLIIILLAIAALILLVPAGSAEAAPVQDDQVSVGEDLTLREGERVDGDVLVLGGNFTMREDSRVEGNATVVGGNAQIDGEIQGDLTTFGGHVTLSNLARVGGNVVALGGRVDEAPGADVGSIVQGPSVRNFRFWDGLRPTGFPRIIGTRPESAIFSALGTLMGTVILSVIGMAVYAVWPRQTDEVGRTIVNAPLPSLGVGCLIYPVAAFVALIILITICLAIFVPVVALLVVAASLFGWIALGVLLGRWLAGVTGWRTATPLAVSGLGVFILSFAAAILGEIPCLGSLVVLGAASIGLGAVTLSRFGTRRFGAPSDAAPVPAGPPAPPVPPETVPSTVPEDALDAAIREAIAEPVEAEPTPEPEPTPAEPEEETGPATDSAPPEDVATPQEPEEGDKTEDA
jgi:hypothetical protein